MLTGVYQLNLAEPRLYAIVAPATGWADPTPAQILAGLDGNGAPAVWYGNADAPNSTTVDFDWPVPADGLTPGVTYRVAIVWSDGVNLSNVGL